MIVACLLAGLLPQHAWAIWHYGIQDGISYILDENGFAPGIMSRKKQILPVIIDTLNK